MIVTIAEAEVEVKGVTAIGDLEVTIGDPGMLLACLSYHINAKEFAKYVLKFVKATVFFPNHKNILHI